MAKSARFGTVAQRQGLRAGSPIALDPEHGLASFVVPMGWEITMRFKKHSVRQASCKLVMGTLICAAPSVGCSDIDFVQAVVEASPDIWKKNSERFNAPLNWSVCPDGFVGECAVLQVPVDWLDLRSESLEITIARRPAKDPKNAKGSFWLLDGGPGSNGIGFTQGVDAAWPKLLEDYNVYTIIHRGAFHSELLSCPSAEKKDSPGGVELVHEEAKQCVSELKKEWGSDLLNFRTSHAARDLSHAIRRTRAPGEKVFVYGFSYGTLLAQRFAQISPRQVDGIVLDGILPPNNISYFDFDSQYDKAGERIAKSCAQDSFCSDKWGSDPWKKLLQLKAKLNDGHCEALDISPSQLSQLTARLLARVQSREDAFALLYRIDRCEDADVGVVKHYFKTLKDLQDKGAESWDPRGFSSPLFYNIIFTEVTGGGKLDIPSIAQVEQACEDAVFCPGFSGNARRIYEHWPQYKADRFFGKNVKFKVPVLAMSGRMDAQTPIEKARSIKSTFQGSSQSFVEFPFAPHCLWGNSAVKQKKEMNCAGQLVSQFLKAPQQKLDTDCVRDLVGLNFQGDPKRNEMFFATEDAWENDEELSSLQASFEAPNWDEIIEALDSQSPWELRARY